MATTNIVMPPISSEGSSNLAKAKNTNTNAGNKEGAKGVVEEGELANPRIPNTMCQLPSLSPEQQVASAEEKGMLLKERVKTTAKVAGLAALKLSAVKGRKEGGEGEVKVRLDGGKEILRAMAEVSDIRQRRMNQESNPDGKHGSAGSKKKKRREELMRRRQEMEQQMREQEAKLAELAEEAKKKAEEAKTKAKLEMMGTEAQAEAEERIRSEAEAVAQLEKVKNSEIAQQRINIEQNAKDKEVELAKLTEKARRKVEEQMKADEAAITMMEKQAAELVKKREELAQRVKLNQEKASYEEEQLALQQGQLKQKGMRQKLAEKLHKIAASSGGWRKIAKNNVALHALIGLKKGAGEETEREEPLDLPFAKPAMLQEPLPGVCNLCMSSEGLPVSHAAAAEGHLNCLAAIMKADRDLLSEVDASERTPAFYAAANGNAEALNLLLQAGCDVTQPDESGDRPLHAAATGGNEQCARTLLSVGGLLFADPQPRNCRGMTPAHMASSVDVLESLFECGAEMDSRDNNGRTPLFFAAATDKVEAVNFLCEVIDSQGIELGQPDRRGDTPLHAAACNGATSSVLLLLQYGTPPDVRNSKGLRPIDLAARRGHTAVEKVLKEYELHHSISDSYFDSVLFLATLDGHRKVKEILVDPNTIGDVPEQIRKSIISQSFVELGSSTELLPDDDILMSDKPHLNDDLSSNLSGATLQKQASMWSMRRGSSIRLQQWGDWIAYEDEATHAIFWYNHITQDTQWERPDEIEILQHEDMEAKAPEFKQLAAKSMRLRKDGDWISYTAPDGRILYYNDTTSEFQWERPALLLPIAPEINGDGDGRQCLIGNGEDEMMTDAASQWIKYKDPASGLSFWHDHKSGTSKWDAPLVVDQQQQPGDILEDTHCSSNGTNEQGKAQSHEGNIIQVGEGEEDATEVTSGVNDLFGAKAGGGVPPHHMKVVG